MNWRRIALVAMFAVFFVLDVRLAAGITRTQPLGIDFAVIWAGLNADPARLYDFGYITHLQEPLFGGVGRHWVQEGVVRPFVYPPTALLILGPLGRLPFWLSYGLFTAASTGLYLWEARRLGADLRVLLLPPVLLVPLGGQVTFLLGGLVLLGLRLLHRPALAGMAFGVAGAIKPQMLVLLPLALASAGAWRTFVSTGAMAGLLLLGSLLTGAGWPDWLAALPRFQEVVASRPRLLQTTITPYAAGGPATLWLTVPIACALVWMGFRSRDVARRALALVGGALLISPYAMNYELALLAPLTFGWWPAMLAIGFAFWLPSPLALAGAMTAVARRP